jgi:hypothetical protein
MGLMKRPALFSLAALVLVLIPSLGYAQTGSIAGVARDSQGGVLPGVTVEVTSPQLIGGPRVTVTDEGGRYQIPALPVGTYKITFKLERFATVERSNIELTSDFTAAVNADLKVGAASEIVTVQGSSTLVDVQNARQRQVFTREELVDLPITRNLNSLVQLVPGIAISTAGFSGNSVPTICSGGQADGAAGVFNSSGAASGCGPILGGFNAHGSMNDPASLNQGRMQVDGLGIQSFGGGGRSSYIADIGNAQEVTFNLSGALGESETGGTTINIIPRTGGNRYSGNFFTGYSSGRFFGHNDETRPSTFQNRLDYEYDVNGAYGGPIIKDRLWFYGAARRQQRQSLLYTNFRNLNEGIFGANYMTNFNSQIFQDDIYQNGSLRLTVQATQRDKFNVFWDEQYTCETPCNGSNGGTSNEAQGSFLTYPLHVAQLSWTNPLSNKILLEAGFSHYGAHRDETKNINIQRYASIPRIAESGTTSDYVNIPGALGNAITSGSINNAIDWRIDNVQSRASAAYVTGSHNVKFGYQGQYLSRASNPYYNDLRLNYTYATPTLPTQCTTTACVNAANAVNGGGGNQRLVTTTTPSGGAAIQNGCYFNPVPLTGTAVPQQISTTTGQTSDRQWCGSINLPGNPAGLNDPINSQLRPIPSQMTQYIPGRSNEAAWFGAVYLQDQWTLNRFTINGALRYDNAQSNFKKTCVGPDLYKPDQYCLNDPDLGEGKGVRYQDITPRWGITWDVFGNGKTAIKYSQGKYLDGVQAGGIYTAANAAGAGRTVNSYNRTWIDADGDRIVDCDLVIPAIAPSTGLPANGECGAPADNNAVNNGRRFGRSPNALDDLGLAIGLGTINCGQNERSMSVYVRTYCDNYFAAGGKNLMSGWGSRRYEWQLSLGVQHELLPRLSAEVTYNRREYGNVTVTDTLGTGCDLYAIDENPVNPTQCMADLFNYKSSTYDFYSIQAPLDPALPNGGNFAVQGIATPKQRFVTRNNTTGVNTVTYMSAAGTVGVDAVTIAPEGTNIDYWSGIDTNFVLRARGGLRVSGGTSTGRRNVDNCALQTDNPPGGVRLMEGRELDCNRKRDFQTNLRGTASYTIPWVDVLASATFSYRPGVQINANYTVGIADVVFPADALIVETAANVPAGSSALPAGSPRVPALQLVPFVTTATQTTANLLSNDTYGEGIRIFDFRLAKNIRFGGKRVNIGVDVFNVFNSDAALGYCATYPNPSQNIQGCGNAAAGTLVPWGAVNNITTPRYARFQMQFDF